MAATKWTECPVPYEQQPISEYQSLSESLPFSWASGDFVEFCSRLIDTGASSALFVALRFGGPTSKPLKLFRVGFCSYFDDGFSFAWLADEETGRYD
ncbi:hypothetical protein GQ457_12G031600 [Hibiscus cannabinus]